MENTEENKWTQLCVWPGTCIGTDGTKEEEIKKMEDFFLEEMKTRVKYKCEVLTNPEPGETLEQSGGRSDLFFYVHQDDIIDFAIPRMRLGIKWWEDMIKYNDNRYLYSKEFLSENPPTW